MIKKKTFRICVETQDIYVYCMLFCITATSSVGWCYCERENGTELQ